MALRITTAMVYSSHHYQTQLGGSVTVGEVAQTAQPCLATLLNALHRKLEFK